MYLTEQPDLCMVILGIPDELAGLALPISAATSSQESDSVVSSHRTVEYSVRYLSASYLKIKSP